MKIIKPLVTSIFQLTIAWAIYLFILYLVNQSGHKVSSNIPWGISFQIGVSAFVLAVLVLNFIELFFLSRKQRTLAFLIIVFLFTLPWIKDLTYTPYKTALFLACAYVGFVSKYLIDKLFMQRKL